MKTIAFDVMGNDNGLKDGVLAVNTFMKTTKNYSFILIGNEKEIKKYLEPSNKVIIIHCNKMVNPKNGALGARKSKSSMSIAINLVKDGKALAVLSSGDSGIYLSIATLTLKRLKGIQRPAFMPIGPTIKGEKFLMLDVGANVHTTPIMLYQWAILGKLFATTILQIKNPRVALINNGIEEYKGTQTNKEAFQLLKSNKNINFIGFQEPSILLKGGVDVAVIGGFEGNLILKTLEGTIQSIFTILKQKLKQKFKYKIGALIAKGAFRDIKNIFNLKNVGAAWVVGLNGLVIKSHGNANKQSYLGAFNQIKIALDNDALNKLKKAIK